MSEALIVGVVRQAIETAVMVTLPMLLVGFTLMFMAYRRREASGNYTATPQPA